MLQAVAAGAYADVALERALRDRPLQGPDRGLATEMAYGAIRQRRQLDAWLDRVGRVPALKQPPEAALAAARGAVSTVLDGTGPESAAVNTCVELAKTQGLARLAPVVNGMLRAALRARDRGRARPVPVMGRCSWPSSIH